MASKPVPYGKSFRIQWRHPKIDKRQHFQGTLPECEAAARYVSSPEIHHEIETTDPALTTLAFLDSPILTVYRADLEAKTKATTTFGGVAEREITKRQEDGVINESTAKNHRRRLYNQLADLLPVDVTAITTDLLNKKYRALVATNTMSTATGATKTMAMVVRTAFDEGLVRPNPLKGFTFEDDPTRARIHRAITMDQFRALVGHAVPGGQTEVMAWLLASTGLRLGELLALQVRDFRMTAKPSVYIARALVKGEGGRIVIGDPKAGSEGVVGFSAKTEGFDLAGSLAPFLAGRPSGAFVFDRNGSHWNPSSWRTCRWEAMVRDAKEAGDIPSDLTVTPHDLRHSYGSWLIHANVPISTVSKRMRHSSIAVTHRIYFDETLYDGVAVERALSRL